MDRRRLGEWRFQMAGKLVTLDEAAKQMGISSDELNELRSRGEIYGYRDGATWKFKPEDIEKLIAERANPSAEGSGVGIGESSEDVILLSEFELGSSGPSTSSTVIGKPGQGLAPDDSDIRLTTREATEGSDVKLAGLSGVTIASAQPMAPSAGGSDLELAPSDSANVIDSGSDLSLADSSSGGSNVIGPDDPDEFVLHASGVGSDITISPGDSGISLLDPSDSGLSLEVPLELKKPKDEDSEEFEMSSGDAIVSPEDSAFDSDAVIDVRSDDEFLLTPLEEVVDEDSQDSGSQVIALDTDSGFLGDSSAPLVGDSEPSVSMSGMLEAEDSSSGSMFESGGFGGGAPAAAAVVPVAVVSAPRENQFSGLVVLSLSLGVLFLALGGMMMYDLMVHIWSWDHPPATLNSSIMDFVINTLGV